MIGKNPHTRIVNITTKFIDIQYDSSSEQLTYKEYNDLKIGDIREFILRYSQKKLNIKTDSFKKQRT